MKDFVNYPLFVDTQNNVKDTASLDTFIMNQMDNSSMYQQNFQMTYDCPGFMGQGQRFHLTYFQGMLTYLALNSKSGSCPPSNDPATKKFVCQSSCMDAKGTLDGIFKNSMFCNQSPSTSIATARSQTLSTYDTICSVLPAKDCIAAVGEEKMQAGFPQVADAMSYCGPGGQGNLIKDSLCDVVMLNSLSVGASKISLAVTATAVSSLSVFAAFSLLF
ncbi:hypothetical protein BC830DRAFT_1079227 [Chytriomyces sp. MP71]|nr:hypothetical protein BC830DRAFT_1079227 [Chytriomyces sp. MP71]